MTGTAGSAGDALSGTRATGVTSHSSTLSVCFELLNRIDDHRDDAEGFHYSARSRGDSVVLMQRTAQAISSGYPAQRSIDFCSVVE